MAKLAQMAVRQALERMQMRPVMVEPTGIASIINSAQQMMAGGDILDDMTEELMAKTNDNLCQTYGYSGSTRGKNFAFTDGTAIIPVHGSLVNRYGGYYYGEMTGYNFIRRQRAEAMADPDVERIIYDVNSNGGEADGCFELSDESFELRGEKPTLAVVDSRCYSAAYAFASSADKISVTPSGGAGSIGVISMHTDVSKLLEDYGVKITLISAGKHKADGNPFQQLDPDVRASIQADVDATRDKFVALVARNRGLDEKVVRDTEARTFSADEALALNLIDEVATPTQAVASFITGPSGSSNEANSMKTGQTATTTQPDQTAAQQDANQQMSVDAAAAAKTAERTRLAGIMGCELAAANPALANHLAFNTDMTVEDAVATMTAANVGATANASNTATVEPEQPNQNANSNFLSAMDNDRHPNVGVDVGTNDGKNADTDRDPLMADFEMATGYKFDK